MKKLLVVSVVIMLMCALMIPAFAASGLKIKKQETSTTTNSSQNLGSVYYGNANCWVSSEYAEFAYTSGIVANQAVIDYLIAHSPSGQATAILNQIRPTVGTELALTGAAGGYVDMCAVASGFAAGSRGGVYSRGGASTADCGVIACSVSKSSSNSIVGKTIVNTVNINTNNTSGTVTFYEQSATRWVSPIVLDMVGKGVLEASNGKYLPHSSYTKDHAMIVDFYNNGFDIAMEWVGPNDGLLIAPKADGTVDATCLFGTSGGFDNGFQKLSLWDKNNDRQVSGDELAGLAVWQDKNQNGIVDNGEMSSLKDAGITSLSLNQKDFVSSFVRNGKTYKMWDWWPTAIELRKIGSK